MNSQDFNLIENYLEGSLDELEKQQVEMRLKNDPGFSETFRRHQAAHQLLEVGVGIRLKEQLRTSRTQNPESRIRAIHPRIWFLVAAAVLIVLFLVSGSWYANDRYSNENLLDLYAEAYAAGPNRGATETESQWSEGIMAYTRGDYNEASALFSKIAPGDIRYTESRFYLGQALLQNRQPEKAIAAFDEVIDQNDLRFGPAAEWYRAMALFAGGQYRPSRFAVEKIAADSKHAYQEKAVRFLTDLGSFWRKVTRE